MMIEQRLDRLPFRDSHAARSSPSSAWILRFVACFLLLGLGFVSRDEAQAQPASSECEAVDSQACVWLEWRSPERGPRQITHPRGMPTRRSPVRQVWLVPPDPSPDSRRHYSFTIAYERTPAPITLTFRTVPGQPSLRYRVGSEALVCGGEDRRRILAYDPRSTDDVLLSNILSISRLFGQRGCSMMMTPEIGEAFVSLLCAYANADGSLVLDRYFLGRVKRFWPGRMADFQQCVAASERSFRRAPFARANVELAQTSGRGIEVDQAVARLEAAVQDPQIAAAAAAEGLSLTPYRAHRVGALNATVANALARNQWAEADAPSAQLQDLALDPEHRAAFERAEVDVQQVLNVRRLITSVIRDRTSPPSVTVDNR